MNAGAGRQSPMTHPKHGGLKVEIEKERASHFVSGNGGNGNSNSGDADDDFDDAGLAVATRTSQNTAKNAKTTIGGKASVIFKSTLSTPTSAQGGGKTGVKSSLQTGKAGAGLATNNYSFASSTVSLT